MRAALGTWLLVVLLHGAVESKDSAPVVQVYSRNPYQLGQNNTLICHVNNFHPPEISVQLLKNGDPIRDCQQTDLAFEEGWHYHLTTSVSFTPSKGDQYFCRVTHRNVVNTFYWEPDM